MSRRRLVAGIGVIVVAGVAVLSGRALARPAGMESAVTRSTVDPDTMRLVPQGMRIKVEVLNGSGERGVARRAMHYLRQRGFDVVAVGNAAARTDSSVVIVRGDVPGEWAGWAVRAVSASRVDTVEDRSRFLHLSIVLGPDFRPPAQILYP